MKTKKLAVLFAVAALATVTVAGCFGGQKETTAEITKETEAAATAEATTAAETEAAEATREAAEAAAEADEENYDTGGASKNNTRSQDEIGENELLVVSLGISYNDSRRLTIDAIEGATEKVFPSFAVRRGFTSQIVIDHVKSRDDVAIDNMGEALDHAERNGVRNLVIQPTHLMNGLGYTDLVNEVAEYSDAFKKVAVEKPLLTTDDDFRAVMKTIIEAAARYNDGEAAICFMGHGTEADSNQVYAKMQNMLTKTDYRNYYVGIVRMASGLDDILTAVKEGSYRKVVLEPLMIVANDHANNDMAGDEEGSRKAAFEDAGYEVTCLVSGLSELEAIKQLFVGHAQAAVDSLIK